VIRKLFLRSWRRVPYQHPGGSSQFLKTYSRAVTPAMLEVMIVQTLRGSIVCNRSDKEFRKLRLTRAYI